MANQEILCSVNSCYYNEGGARCKAAKIMVNNNMATLRNANMEIGSLGKEAGVSNQTLCDTFIPQDKGPKPGIQRLP